MEHVKKPEWLKIKIGTNQRYTDTKRIVDTHRLHTICSSGRCPNLGECWGKGTATFMIGGAICTRACKFCNTQSGKPLPLDLPYKPKKRTKAEIARQKGLEPLALKIMMQRGCNLDAEAQKFVRGEVKDKEEALAGARDIIAEQISENEEARKRVRRVFERTALITAKVVKGKEEEGDKFKDYFDFKEPLRKCSSHRLLALRRGEAEGVLRVSIAPAEDEDCLQEQAFCKAL